MHKKRFAVSALGKQHVREINNNMTSSLQSIDGAKYQHPNFYIPIQKLKIANYALFKSTKF